MMSKGLKNWFLLAVISTIGVVLIGCSDSPPPNPAGAEAGQKKEYSTEDAMSAVPKRNGSGE